MHRGSTALGEFPIAQQDALRGPGLEGLLAQQHIGQQRHRLDVAACPARIRRGDAGEAIAQGGLGHLRPGCAVREHQRRHLRQRRMVAGGFRATREVQVDVLVARAIGLDQLLEDGLPAGLRMRVVQLQRRGAARQPLVVQAGAEQASVVDGDHLIDAVAEQEAAVEGRDARLGQLDEPAIQVAPAEGRWHGAR